MKSNNSFYAHKKILVTGGAGFIGSHLSELLIAHGAHVRILDNLSTGNRNNIKDILSKINLVEESITSLEACSKATKGIEIVFHLAAEVSVAKSQHAPHNCLETNTQGTANLLEAARVNGCRRVILASSAAVYGNHEGICTEDLIPQPVSTYGYSKLLAEQLCQLYADSYALETVRLRYFNVYGPRQNYAAGTGGVLAILENRIKNNEPITLFGDGQQTRDFIHVDDVVQATLQAGMISSTLVNGQAFNVATGTSKTLQAQLEELLRKYPHYQQQISYLSERPGDVKHSQADCSKLKKALEL